MDENIDIEIPEVEETPEDTKKISKKVVKKLEKNAENKGKKVMGFHKKQLKKVLKTVKIVISRH